MPSGFVQGALGTFSAFASALLRLWGYAVPGCFSALQRAPIHLFSAKIL